jgi:hypothetical protein
VAGLLVRRRADRHNTRKENQDKGRFRGQCSDFGNFDQFSVFLVKFIFIPNPLFGKNIFKS